MPSLSSGSVTINGSAVSAYSVQISAAGGAGGNDTIDVTTLSDNQIKTFDRPLKAAGAAGAKYNVTVEYFGTAVAASPSASCTIPVLGTVSGCTVSSSSTTYGANDVIRGSATVLVP